MSRTAIREWFERGTFSQRFAKEFFLYFVISAAGYSAIHYLGPIIHWKLGGNRPFVSEDFWVTCLSVAFGFAIVGANPLKPKSKHEGMV